MEPFPEVHSGRQQEDSRRTAGRNVTEKRPAEGYSHISDEYHGKTQKRDRRSDPLSVIGDQSPPLSEISIILTQDVPYLERHNAYLLMPGGCAVAGVTPGPPGSRPLLQLGARR